MQSSTATEAVNAIRGGGIRVRLFTHRLNYSETKAVSHTACGMNLRGKGLGDVGVMKIADELKVYHAC